MIDLSRSPPPVALASLLLPARLGDDPLDLPHSGTIVLNVVNKGE